MITHEIHLTAGSLVVNHDIYAVQYDTDRAIRMFVDDITVTSEMTGRLEFQRSDGTYYGLDASLETETGSFYIPDITQLLTQPGRAKCQLKISNEGNVVSTYTYDVWVVEDTTGTITPQEKYNIDEAVASAEQAKSKASTAITTATSAQELANSALRASQDANTTAQAASRTSSAVAEGCDDLEQRLDSYDSTVREIETFVDTQTARIDEALGNAPPAVTTADNGKVLMVVNGSWAAANLPLYDGTVN